MNTKADGSVKKCGEKLYNISSKENMQIDNRQTHCCLIFLGILQEDIKVILLEIWK